jgi:hypothetical protein
MGTVAFTIDRKKLGLEKTMNMVSRSPADFSVIAPAPRAAARAAADRFLDLPSGKSLIAVLII